MTSIPTLNTDRLILRAPVLEDFPAYAAFWASDRSTFVGGPHDERWAWGKFAAHVGHWALRGFGWWSVQSTDGLVGLCGIHRPSPLPRNELGWTLYANETGKGYATEAAAAACRWWFGRGEDTLVAHIDSDHAASQAVARRIGGRDTGEAAQHQPSATIWMLSPDGVAQ